MQKADALVAIALALVCGPAVAHAAAAAAVLAVPPLGDALPGGTVSVFLDAHEGTPGQDWTCYWVGLGPGESRQVPSSGHACVQTGLAGPTLTLQAPKARGTLVVETADQKLAIPYVAPPGTHQSAWAGLTGGELRAGSTSLSPTPTTPFAWAAVQAVAVVAALAGLALGLRLQWVLAAFAVALACVLAFDGDGSGARHVGASTVLLMALAAFGVRVAALFRRPVPAPAPAEP